MFSLNDLYTDLELQKNPKQAQLLMRYFKTGPGQYGAGDIFLGLMTPQSRSLVKKYSHLPLKDIDLLLQSNIHEHRSIALGILKDQYLKADHPDKKTYFDFYLAHTDRINNWDLVDTSAPHVVGNYLLDKDRSLLYKLVKSQSLWERRIAIISTFAFIKINQFDDTLEISTILLKDGHDLIHKAVGWALREVGKKSPSALTDFLDLNWRLMPRTTLRYAIEKLPPAKRAYYLKLR